MGLKICISNEFPDDAKAFCLSITLSSDSPDSKDLYIHDSWKNAGRDHCFSNATAHYTHAGPYNKCLALTPEIQL